MPAFALHQYSPVSLGNIGKLPQVINHISPIVSLGINVISFLSGAYDIASGWDHRINVFIAKLVNDKSIPATATPSLLQKIKHVSLSILKSSYEAMKTDFLRIWHGISLGTGAIIEIIHAIKHMIDPLLNATSRLLKVSGICFLLASVISLIRNIKNYYIMLRNANDRRAEGYDTLAKTTKKIADSHLYQAIGNLISISGYISILLLTGGLPQCIGAALIAIGGILSFISSYLTPDYDKAYNQEVQLRSPRNANDQSMEYDRRHLIRV